MAVPFDRDSAVARGAPVRVLEDVFSFAWGNFDVVFYSMSDSGTLAYVPGGRTFESRAAVAWCG